VCVHAHAYTSEVFFLYCLFIAVIRSVLHGFVLLKDIKAQWIVKPVEILIGIKGGFESFSYGPYVIFK